MSLPVGLREHMEERMKVETGQTEDLDQKSFLSFMQNEVSDFCNAALWQENPESNREPLIWSQQGYHYPILLWYKTDEDRKRNISALPIKLPITHTGERAGLEPATSRVIGEVSVAYSTVLRAPTRT